MSPMVRNIVAVVVGVIVGFVVIMAAQYINSLFFPPPPGTDLSDPNAMAAMLRQMSTGAFVGLVLGYLLGPTAGCYAAVRLAGDRPFATARLVALVFIIGGIFNFRAYPHPTWVVVASFLAFAAAPFLAIKRAGKTTTA
ncbi:MAG: hypothetical protein ACT4P7_23975 [Gemmatimonadaceae bacterium]